MMELQKAVSKQDWLSARKALMVKEKEFTRLRDELSAERRQLPWVRLDKYYQFEGENGPLSLSEMFGDQSQLAIYHFMYGPDWGEGCPSCSYWADNYNGTQEHLAHRDIKLAAISRAPIKSLLEYRQRMGWTFEWYSSAGSEFNFDFAVSFTPEQIAAVEKPYNFGTMKFSGEEAPGFSFFYKADDGALYHTYSTFARGLDMLNSSYHLMDMAPKGRDEEELDFTMAWLRRRDQY